MAASSSSSSSAVLSPPPLLEGDGHDAPNWVLLDILGYMGDYPNATLAKSFTSTGERIEVSFHTARPPQVSHFCVHCPDLGPACFVVPPKVISADSDLILFRVSVCPQARFNPRYCDYFLYRARPQKSSLYLLPHPYPNSFKDREVALLSFGNDDEYAVAALARRYQSTALNKKEFNLYVYRYSKKQDGWVSKVVSVEEPRRDKVCPLDYAPYHDTTKVIILGRGSLGMVGWVDLWRGILVCNVLEQDPVLLDIPLPLPLSGNRRLYHKCCPNTVRDITVNLLKDSIKYIEIQNPWEKVVSPDHPTDSNVRQMQGRVPSRAWQATTWRRPIPIDSREDWQVGCNFDVADIKIDPMHTEQLPRLRDNPSKATLPADLIGFPTMSMDDDVFYLLYMAYRTGQKDVVVSINMKKNTLQGFAKLATGKDFTFTRNCTSEISKYLSKDEGTREASETSLLQEKTSLLRVTAPVKSPNILVRKKGQEELLKFLQKIVTEKVQRQT